jgi:predicted AAA+ superfamily ATPase
MVKKYTRLLKRPDETFFLLGVRGVGKSTWIRNCFKQPPIYYDLLNEDLFSELLINKSLFYKQLSAEKAHTWVVVDEIQRIPGLLNECHRLIEERRLRFSLLGSSARKLRQQGVNLLGGRATQIELFPLLPEELADDFNLDSYLAMGGIPLIVTSPNPANRLKAYVQTYLREEIRQEALVRNIEGFTRFLPIAGLFHGQVLNIEGLARDAGVARSTVQGYLEILEETLLAYRLKAFEGRLRVKEKKHPKFYWIDSGLARAAKGQFGMVAPEERGALLEGVIIQIIRTYQSLRNDLYDDIYYWSVGRKESSIEVDLLLMRTKEIVAIEIKSSAIYNSSWTRGLVAVSELKGVSRKILVYTGERSFKTDNGVEVYAFEKFLELLRLGKI